MNANRNRPDESHNACVVSFVSGKGGSGKTTTALSMAKLLSEAGLKVLLIDCDLATNGASYFFTTSLGNKQLKGILEIWDGVLPGYLLGWAEVEENLLKVSEKFFFLASRSDLSRKAIFFEVSESGKRVFNDFLSRILSKGREKFDFIIIDNQAGSNQTCEVACHLSDKVVIVSEPDPISSDMVNTVLVQMGDSLPSYRRYLITKLDIRDTEYYKHMSDVFQSLNFLPPLPFDFEVRNLFGSRQFPIRTEKPSPFLFALLNCTKALLPESIEHTERYEAERVTKLFDEYHAQLDSLIERKRALDHELASTREKKFLYERRRDTVRMTAVYLGLISAIALTFYRVIGLFVSGPLRTILSAAIFYVGGALWFGIRSVTRRRAVFTYERQVHEETLEKHLSDIEKEIERYKSLLLTKSKDFLITFGKTDSGP